MLPENIFLFGPLPRRRKSIPAVEDTCERLADRLQFIKAAGIHELANGQISAHYDFRHSLYREVLYRRLSEGARSKLHLLLAQRLQAFCDPCEQELATELALHFEGGHDYEQAIHYLILAAKNAAGRLLIGIRLRFCAMHSNSRRNLDRRFAPNWKFKFLSPSAMPISFWAPCRSPRKPTEKPPPKQKRLASKPPACMP